MVAWCKETLTVHRSGEPVATKCEPGMAEGSQDFKDQGTLEIASSKLRGHYNYYGVTDNYRRLVRFDQAVKKLLFKWLNRRGKRNCLNWDNCRFR